MQANKLTLHIYIRKIHAINKGHKAQQYEYLTSISGLHQHLMKDHLDDWVTGLRQLWMSIVVVRKNMSLTHQIQPHLKDGIH